MYPGRKLSLTLRIQTAFLEHLDLNTLKDATFWALILIGFYCMLRKSKLVPDKIDTFDSRKQLCRANIKINSHSLMVEIKWSKTIWFILMSNGSLQQHGQIGVSKCF